MEIVIDSVYAHKKAMEALSDMVIDGSMTVQIKKTDKSSTAKQRRLQWLWYSEVAVSGIGRNDTKEGVHLDAKWEWARPILLEEDEVFGLIFSAFMKEVQGSIIFAEACKVFAQQYISTERLTKRQRARYLTDFQMFWSREGVSLTDPESLGKNLLKYAQESK